MPVPALMQRYTRRASAEIEVLYYKQSSIVARLLDGADRFDCPLCGWSGRFMPTRPIYGRRLHAICPNCKSMERHRLQKLVVDEILEHFSPQDKACLQFAPDPMTRFLRASFGTVVTADIDPRPNSLQIDMRAIPFRDASFDFVFASHVLEHIKEDLVALRELYRILKPGGMAALPVPIICEATIEYPQAMPREEYHVRAPGLDYFDRYRSVFDAVKVFTSEQFDQRYQTYVYEDRSGFPNEICPHRSAMEGYRHLDAVPVCWKA